MSTTEEPTKFSAEQFAAFTKVDVLDTVLTGLFVVVFSLVLLVFDLLQRIAHLIDLLPIPRIKGTTYQQWIVSGLYAALYSITILLGMRVHFSFSEQLDKRKQYIFLSNHQSLFDIFLLAWMLRPWHPRFVAKKELGKWIPSISFNLRIGGHALVNRKNPRQAVTAIDTFAQRAHDEHYTVVLFPEGTRSRDGALLPYRGTGFQRLAELLPNAEVVPIAIDGSWRTAAYRNKPVPRGIQISIVAGQSLGTAGALDVKQALIDARAFTQAALLKHRNPYF